MAIGSPSCAAAQTVSHLRFGPQPVRSPYLIRSANFVACHQFGFLPTRDVLSVARRGATVLLNSPFPAEQVWDALPAPVQEQVLDKQLQRIITGHVEGRNQHERL